MRNRSVAEQRTQRDRVEETGKGCIGAGVGEEVAVYQGEKSDTVVIPS